MFKHIQIFIYFARTIIRRRKFAFSNLKQKKNFTFHRVSSNLDFHFISLIGLIFSNNLAVIILLFILYSVRFAWILSLKRERERQRPTWRWKDKYDGKNDFSKCEKQSKSEVGNCSGVIKLLHKVRFMKTRIGWICLWKESYTFACSSVALSFDAHCVQVRWMR